MTANRRTVLAYLIFPVLGYPVYFVMANAIDSLFGDRQLILWLLFEPPGDLPAIFLSDWKHSLPAMFAVFIALFMPVHALLSGFKRLNAGLFGGVVSSVMFGFSWIVGFSVSGVFANTLTVLLLAMLTLVFTRTGRSAPAAR